jgi:hypothetical protein
MHISTIIPVSLSLLVASVYSQSASQPVVSINVASGASNAGAVGVATTSATNASAPSSSVLAASPTANTAAGVIGDSNVPVWVVKVGSPDNQIVFAPNTIMAKPGEMVQFQFYSQVRILPPDVAGAPHPQDMLNATWTEPFRGHVHVRQALRPRNGSARRQRRRRSARHQRFLVRLHADARPRQSDVHRAYQRHQPDLVLLLAGKALPGRHGRRHQPVRPAPHLFHLISCAVNSGTNGRGVYRSASSGPDTLQAYAAKAAMAPDNISPSSSGNGNAGAGAAGASGVIGTGTGTGTGAVAQTTKGSGARGLRRGGWEMVAAVVAAAMLV